MHQGLRGWVGCDRQGGCDGAEAREVGQRGSLDCGCAASLGAKHAYEGRLGRDERRETKRCRGAAVRMRACTRARAPAMDVTVNDGRKPKVKSEALNVERIC
jgi:hypothetical protein